MSGVAWWNRPTIVEVSSAGPAASASTVGNALGGTSGLRHILRRGRRRGRRRPQQRLADAQALPVLLQGDLRDGIFRQQRHDLFHGFNGHSYFQSSSSVAPEAEEFQKSQDLRQHHQVQGDQHGPEDNLAALVVQRRDAAWRWASA